MSQEKDALKKDMQSKNLENQIKDLKNQVK